MRIKFRYYFVVIAVVVCSFISLSFVDNYFETSKNLDIFASVFKELNIFYVDETDPGDLMKTAIDNMLASLDPYTNYIPESDIEDYKYMQTGEYGGIGALVRKQGDYVIIAEPYEGFPAQKAGLMAGDRIMEINGLSTKGKSTEEVSKFLRGQASSSIEMLISRDMLETPFKVSLSREEIKVKSVSYYDMIDSAVGYIRLTGFTKNASEEVKMAFKELEENNEMQALVFDLRGNPGGLLNEAIKIVNLFVAKGTDIVSTRGKISEWNVTYSAQEKPLNDEIPVVVLIDKSSASASEIVSGSLQDLDRGVVVGQRSYGKGLVQDTRKLSYNTMLKVTVAKYYIPSGRCIQALDYSHHNKDGSVDKIADSLKTAFKTKNGRTVYDGGGILPDIVIDEMNYSNIAKSLMKKHLIFDYATHFNLTHDSIVNAETFALTDKEYQGFVSFLNNKDYGYKTNIEKALDKMVEEVQQDSIVLQAVHVELEELKRKLEIKKSDDLHTYKEQIKILLEEEIASRYYYQHGRLESSFRNDKQLDTAISIARNMKVYNKVLSPPTKN